MPDDNSALYGRDFFDAQGSASLRSARIVLPELFRHVRPLSVVDIGCGIGTWLCAAGELGTLDMLGVDGDYVDRADLMIPGDQFLDADLSTPGLGAVVAARRPGQFDLAMCLEVAEHLPFERSGSFVAELCGLADLVLFSAALPFQHGTGHVNEQWPEFWATQFRANGFACFDLVRPEVWGRPDVDWWYAQNVLVFAREGSEVAARLPPGAAVHSRPLARVHPEAWLSDALCVWHPHRGVARDEELHDFRAVAHGWSGGAHTLPALRAVERSRQTQAGARDVFPFTRTETVEPERLIAEAEARGDAARGELAAVQGECVRVRDELAAAQGAIRLIEAERAEMEALRAAYAAEGDRAEALHRALGRVRYAHDVLQAEATQLGTDFAASQARLEGLEKRSTVLQAANTTLRGQVARHDDVLRETVAGHAQTVAALQQPLVQAQEDVRRLEAEARVRSAAAEAAMAALLRSTSWRITAPLRGVKRLFG